MVPQQHLKCFFWSMQMAFTNSAEVVISVGERQAGSKQLQTRMYLVPKTRFHKKHVAPP